MPESDKPAPLTCAECGYRQPTLITETECVAIYKCPKCGRLQAPVKNRGAGAASG